MESNNKNKGPHLKTCICGCEIEFWGRRNQKFLDHNHKNKVNNLKRAMRMEPLSKLFSQLETNYRILVKYYLLSKGNRIKYSDLLKEGFDPNAPCTFQKNKNDGVQYRVLLNYCFNQSPDNQFIQIFKL